MNATFRARLLPTLARCLAGGALLVVACSVASCSVIEGTGSGTQPKPGQFLHVDASSHSAVLVLIAGYPVTDSQFNFDGYSDGQLTIRIPSGWTVIVQCQNRGTVPHSCSIAKGRQQQPAEPGWTTPDPATGVKPGRSAAFQFVAGAPGDYRVVCLVPGHEASGMWDVLKITSGGSASISAAPL